jgi:cytochrome c biogenesis protein CcdA
MNNLITLAPSLDQLSRIIGSVAAPAFLLGAVAAFISVLMSRMNRVIDRSQFLHGIADTDRDRSYLKADIPRLKRRAVLLNRSVFYATVCAIVTSLLIIVAFVSAMLHLQHEYGVAIFFIIALAFFLFALVDLARETRIGLHDLDHHV